MGRKEEVYIVLSLLLGVSGCAGTWLALPLLQPWLAQQLENPLFVPLVLAVALALLLLLLLGFLLRD